ncbi:PspA/IM30 family protein [Bacteroidetes/Chlorobi group bacterium ChocPot_Mid]|jgi:phage shock protein A|nr:MAG: PspA/IM30 family protein [Bacteroidetes/Chlorobi group bacterium ChocPot_Mid]
MGIFNRIADVVKANINELLDKAEDPEKMLKQMVIEMEESINQTALAVARAIANEKTLERKIEKAKKDALDWEQKAVKALNSGREDLAKAALEKKSIETRNFTDLEPVFLQAKETSEKLRNRLATLKSKLDEARTRQNTLIARSQAAKAEKQVSQAMAGVGSDAFSKFDKFERKVEQIEAEASAFGELADTGKRLEEEFKLLERDSSVDNELLALKQKMGLLPS